jgi:hypothetical protein
MRRAGPPGPPSQKTDVSETTAAPAKLPAMPYFQRRGWSPFLYQGATYDLSHLDEYQLTVRDSANIDRMIAVTFSDHCFTSKPMPRDDPGLLFPGSSREPGHFSLARYHLTLGLPGHIEWAMRGSVWYVGGDNYAIVPTVDQEGNRVLYAVVFSLSPVTGLPVDLHMRVESAYPTSEKSVATFGSVRFRHLVALRIQHKRPKRITDQRRKVPRIG